MGEIQSSNDVICKDLRKVVAKVTPPGGTVGYVSQGVGKVHQVHYYDQIQKSAGVQFIYFVAESESLKVKKMFFESVTISCEENIETEHEVVGTGISRDPGSEDDDTSDNSEDEENNHQLTRQPSSS